MGVLIESDWNLKLLLLAHQEYRWDVLIESDWNLKMFFERGFVDFADRINRIRLEFKEKKQILKDFGFEGINRIRLEFKDNHLCKLMRMTLLVLIESDWNLKCFNFCNYIIKVCLY